ncbi:RcnB family protein [Sphingobium sp. AN558]|uniref:RcnB family protein n=1 Tax=Sphingobium sp. AN558 TaxID=3133442 RepID=UPI0030C1898D
MKRFLMALAATTMVTSPMIAAQAQAAQHREVTRVVERDNHGRTIIEKRTVVRNDRNIRNDRNVRNDRGIRNGHRWAKGQRFDRRYANNYRVVNNYRDYRLSAPPRGYHWVRSGNDAVMVAITSGIIGAIIGGAIR